MKVTIENVDNDEVEVIVKGSLNNPEVKEILDKLKNPSKLETIFYKDDDKTFYEDISNVEYFTFLDNKVLAVINSEEHKINFSLNELESLKDFIRISKHTIINKKYVKYVEVEFNGNYVLFMKNGNKFILTRKYVKSFKESMR